MKTNRNLLIVCAMGYATSSIIKKAITEFLEENKIKNWNIESTALNMSRDYVDQADIIVSSLEMKQSDYKAPIINGVALISGIGEEAALNEIMDHIRRIDHLD